MNDISKRLAALSVDKRALIELMLKKQPRSAAQKQIIRPRPDHARPAPLSLDQERLWFIHQLNPRSPAYNINLGLRLSGNVDVAVLRRALNEVVRRHEILRTYFIAESGQPAQVAAPLLSLDLSQVDLRSLPEAERDTEAVRLLGEHVLLPFDLREAPLLRALLVRLRENEYGFLITLHHIITDWWSMSLIQKELSIIYQAFVSGSPSPLPDPSVQYADFASWQRSWLQGEEIERLTAHWKQQLAHASHALELPTDYPRPATQTFNGATSPVNIPKPLYESLKSLARQEDATTYMAALGVFQLLLHRYTGQHDFLLGSPSANRNRAGTENMLGYLLNMLVLRAQLGDNPTAREFLRRTRSVVLEAIAHQDMPFGELVARLHPERDLSRMPLVQVSFVFLMGGEQQSLGQLSASEVGGITFSALSFEQGTARYDITFGLWETPEGLTGHLEYNVDLFKAATMQRMAAHFRALMESVIANPDARLSDLPMLSEAETHQLLFEWNEPRRPSTEEQTLAALFEEQAARTPDAVAVVFGDERITYAGLNQRANQLAHHLRSLGVGAEVLVGVLLERSLEMIVGLLGIIKAGGAYLPLEPTHPPERISYILEDAGAAVLLTHASLREQLPGGGRQRTVCLDEDREKIAAHSNSNPGGGGGASPDSLVYVIYTSGSTGQPKGVQISHRMVVNLLQSMRRQPGIIDKDVLLSVTTLSFDIAALEIFLPLIVGARLVVVSREVAGDGQQLSQAIAANKTTIMQATPATWQMLLEANWQGDKRLRILCGGEALTFELAQRLLEKVAALWNMYGPTETTIWSVIRLINSQDTSIRIGHPIANTDVYLLDESLRPVAIGVAGELYIGGDGVARGYLNRPDLTAEKFVPHPFSGEAGARLYRTGDRARYLADGDIEYLGRRDAQIKLRGFRIELGEIEAAIATHESVGEVAVALRTVAASQQLVAYCVMRAGLSVSSRELRAHVRERLPEYMVPGVLIEVAALPLTPGGKVDRRALPAPDTGQVVTGADYAEARTPVEKGLLEIWERILRSEQQIGIHDNFFELGGHSLLATQLVSRIRELFSVELPLRTVFESPTVAHLSEVIQQGLRVDGALPAPPVVTVSREHPLPLSFAQQRLWFLDQLQPGSSFYNLPTAMRLQGSLDAAALERALAQVISRHEALRTHFEAHDGVPVQVIEEAAPVSLEITDLSGLDEAERAAKVRARAEEETQRGFNLARGPLLRAGLLKLAEEEHVLLLTMHHIISDGWSMGVLVREVTTLYEAYTRGEEATLPPLPIQYADYAVWQRNWLQGETLERELNYWRRQLASAPALLGLPADHARPAVQSYVGASLPFSLSAELSSGLRELSRREGATLFMTLLAAFQVLLSRYSGEEDICVGTPIANRTRAEVEGLIGFFVNTLVMRGDLSGEPSFRELLRRTREVTLGGYAHQEVPFEKLVEETGVERSLSHAPLFQVMFVLQNTAPGNKRGGGSHAARDDGSRSGGGVRARVLEVQETTAKFDLTLEMVEDGGRLSGWLEYNTDLFERRTMERMLRHFERVLAQVVREPERSIMAVELLGEEERAQLLVEWNDTGVDYGQTECIHQLFEAQVERTPDAVALVFEEEQLTYAQLNERANRLAHRLMELGVGAESRVGILLERSVEMVVSLLAVLKAGGAYVPLDPRYPGQRVRYMLWDAGVAVLLTQRGIVERILEEGVEAGRKQEQQEQEVGAGAFKGIGAGAFKVVEVEGEVLAGYGRTNPVVPLAAHNLAYIIYTSGSTGQPKGVAITHASAATFIRWACSHFHRDALAGVLASTSINFDLSVFELFAPLSSGGTALLADNALELPAVAARHDVTLLNVVPAALAELVRTGAVPASVRVINNGGEAITEQLVDEVYGRLGQRVQLWDMYGPTEDTVYSICGRLEAGRRVTIGRPIANTQAYIVDERMEPTPIGVAGELYLGGEGLARGYLNRPDLTAEKFVPHPFSGEAGARLYRTGDRARYLADGDIEYLGRRDAQIKLRGFRIELGEIEAAIATHESVGEVAVALRTVAASQQLVAYCVMRAGLSVSSRELRAHVRERLPEYMVPGVLVEVAALPLTPGGKVDRRALPAPEASALAGEYVGPRTPTEELLADIWCELLGRASVSVHDNFFELGGHSLLATQLVSRVRAMVAVELPLHSVFKSPTVSQLAEAIGQALRQEAVACAPPLLPIGREQALPLSFAQHRLWFLDQLEPGSDFYNIPLALRLQGALDAAALESALNDVVARHESLRTHFASDDGVPVQVISPAQPSALPFRDLSGLAEPERLELARRRAREEAQRPFDLAQRPLLRAELLKLGDEEHVLLLTLHHIIADWWSVGVLVREVTALYEGYARDVEVTLPALPVQYADYAVWQRNWLQGEVLSQELNYWRRQLEGAPALLQLPTDHPRPVVQSYRGASETRLLSADLTSGFRDLCRSADVTLFMGLLAAFQTLLSRYTGQPDICVGSPIANRNRAEAERLIGLFVNMLVLRTQVNADQSFRELLRDVRETTLSAYAHQDLPFEKLVEELQPERSMSHHPLFQVMFTLQNAPVRESASAQMELSPLEMANRTAKFDLTLSVSEETTGLRCQWEYNTDLFAATTIGRMAAHFERLLTAVVAAPEQLLSRHQLLSGEECQRLLVEWNDTGVDYGQGARLHHLFEEQAERTPEAVALTCGVERLTYAQLNARANQLAHHLRSLGVGPEARCGILLTRHADLLVCLLAVLKAGGAYVPLDPAYPLDRLAFMLADAGISTLLTQQSLLPRLPAAHHSHTLVVDEMRAALAALPAHNPAVALAGANLAYVIYTSGSTGQPKGVAITHTNAATFIRWACSHFHRDALAGVLASTSINFDLSVFELFAPLSCGGTALLADNALELPAVAARHDVTLLNVVPAALAELVRTGAVPASVRVINNGGEAITEQLVDEVYGRLGQRVQLWDMYGPTEDTVYSICGRLEAGRRVTIGRPIANTQAYIVDERMEPTPIGVAGELYLGGDGVARGYLNRPDLTAEKFVPDAFSREAGARLYRTGDRARYLADGDIEYLGRADYQVKVRGYRIELGEIETALARHAAVRDAVVVVRGEAEEKQLVAYVVAQDAAPDGAHDAAQVGTPDAAQAGAQISSKELREHLRESLPEYMLPGLFVFLEALPLTPNGKIDRRALPAPEQAVGEEYVAPRTPTEEQLAEICCEVLGVKIIGVEHSFFELGGHSLLATQVTSRVREHFGVEISVRTIFERPSIAGLAAEIVRLRSEAKSRLEAEVLAELDGISEEEAAKLLREFSQTDQAELSS